jgi:hypothetical protein
MNVATMRDSGWIGWNADIGIGRGASDPRAVATKKLKERIMRKVLLTISTAAILSATPALMPARAMPPGTASGIKAALADTRVVDEVAYVCRHRYLSSRRLCWWRPGYRWRWGWRR